MNRLEQNQLIIPIIVVRLLWLNKVDFQLEHSSNNLKLVAPVKCSKTILKKDYFFSEAILQLRLYAFAVACILSFS